MVSTGSSSREFASTGSAYCCSVTVSFNSLVNLNAKGILEGANAAGFSELDPQKCSLTSEISGNNILIE